MTVDEFALSQRANGLKVVKVDGIWWVEIRPFFFRPLYPFAEINPSTRRYPKKAFLGGVLHVVPPEATANANMNFFVYDDLQNYSPKALGNKRQKSILKTVQKFKAKRITDEDEFVSSAYDVYLSFQSRTQYTYMDERVHKESFRIWAKHLFDIPKTNVMGAYHYDNKLAGVEISYLVNDVIIGDTLFADSASIKMNVTDFIYHKRLETMADTDAKYYYVGLPSGVKTLDQSKLYRGAKLIKMPAHYKINPLALSVARIFMKKSYRKLQDITA